MSQRKVTFEFEFPYFLLPTTYCSSFTHFRTRFSSRKGRGKEVSKNLAVKQSLIVLLAPHQDETSKVGDVITPPGPWSTCRSLPRGCGQQYLPIAIRVQVLHRLPCSFDLSRKQFIFLFIVKLALL